MSKLTPKEIHTINFKLGHTSGPSLKKRTLSYQWLIKTISESDLSLEEIKRISKKSNWYFNFKTEWAEIIHKEIHKVLDIKNYNQKFKDKLNEN